MIPKFLSKYGLAVHLAILAAAPLALTPFFTAATLSSVILWLSALAAVWFFLEPTIRSGEHLRQARARVRSATLRDPLFWLCLVALCYAGVRAFNTGLDLFFDIEQGAWRIHEPRFDILPAAHGSSGVLPFCMLFAVTLVAMGVRHGLGRSSRTLFAVFGSFVAGLGALVAALAAMGGKVPFAGWFGSSFSEPPFGFSFFGVWLVLGIAGAVQAEARGWSAARVFYLLGLAGTSSALVLFAPVPVAILWLALAVLTYGFALVVFAHSAKSGPVVRTSVLILLGVGVSVLLLYLLPVETRLSRLAAADPSVCFTKSFQTLSATLSNLARKMMLQAPWLGVGEDAFQLQASFLAEKADWTILPRTVTTCLNGYWMLLATRGIIGVLLQLVGVGLLFTTWALRLVAAIRYRKTHHDSDAVLWSQPPVVWTAPFIFLLLLAEAFVQPIFTTSVFPLLVVSAVVLAAADFSRSHASSSKTKSGVTTSSAGESTHV